MLNSFSIINKPFSDLTSQEIYSILALRIQVFCVEQQCAYQDIDGLDQTAHHFYCAQGDAIVAYARIIPANNKTCYIGRIVVAKNFRNNKLATKIIKACINYCQKHFPQNTIEISAQSYLSDYYQSLGFKSTGKFYLEDDIPHEQMQILVD